MARNVNDGVTSSVFEDLRDKKEAIYWVGKPNAFCFMFSGIPFLAFGCLWGAFDYFFFLHFPQDRQMLWFTLPFFLLHSLPFWGSLLYLAWLWLAHNRTFYAYTSRRLMIRTGAIGTQTRTYDYDGISNLEVVVGPIEKLLGVGSIRFNTGRADGRGNAIRGYFRSIPQPYEIFRKIKETAIDIKTDVNYPNALRPGENPGYRSEYKPGGK